MERAACSNAVAVSAAETESGSERAPRRADRIPNSVGEPLVLLSRREHAATLDMSLRATWTCVGRPHASLAGARRDGSGAIPCASDTPGGRRESAAVGECDW